MLCWILLYIISTLVADVLDSDQEAAVSPGSVLWSLCGPRFSPSAVVVFFFHYIINWVTENTGRFLVYLKKSIFGDCWTFYRFNDGGGGVILCIHAFNVVVSDNFTDILIKVKSNANFVISPFIVVLFLSLIYK